MGGIGIYEIRYFRESESDTAIGYPGINSALAIIIFLNSCR